MPYFGLVNITEEGAELSRVINCGQIRELTYKPGLLELQLIGTSHPIRVSGKQADELWTYIDQDSPPTSELAQLAADRKARVNKAAVDMGGPASTGQATAGQAEGAANPTAGGSPGSSNATLPTTGSQASGPSDTPPAPGSPAAAPGSSPGTASNSPSPDNAPGGTEDLSNLDSPTGASAGGTGAAKAAKKAGK